MKTVRLYGEMGEKFGREFQLDVATPAEAVRALCSLVKGFRVYLHANARTYYKVFVGGRNRSDSVTDPCSKKEIIRLAPAIQGAGGIGKVIIGAILIAASFVAPTWAQPFLFKMGVAMVLSGVIEMLSPLPDATDSSDRERPENKPSHNFDGAVNTTVQGHPVPLAYGRLIVGSAVISGGLETK